MKKLFTFLLALMASSCLWAEITYELDGGKYNDYDWTCKADICYNLQVDYNAAYSKSLAWAKKENGVIYYNIGGTWKTEAEAKGQEASVANFLYPVTWTSNGDPNFKNLIETTKTDKYGWLKEYIEANRAAQNLTGDLSDLGETFYRAEIAAFFLCSPARTSYPKSSSYETTGDYEDFQPYWGQNFPNPTNPTEEVTLVAPHKTGYIFDGWYDNAEFTGSPVTKVNASTTGTLYAKWVLDGIVYELNGGVWNKYGWTSKKDMYDAFLADWKAYSGSTKTSVTYEEQLGAGNSKNGIPAVMYGNDANGNSWKSKLLTFFTDANYSAKWGWLATYLDVVAATQYKKMNAANGPKIQPSTNGDALAYSLGNFFGEDNYYTTNYIDAVDFTGEEAHLAAFQSTWGQTFPNPEHPTEEVTLHTPFKEGYKFLGWYDNEACTGTPITTVNASTTGTLYAKWVLDGIVYELNGGVWNEYGWTSKKDMYDAFLADWKAYSGSTKTSVTYEEQLGAGNSKNGIPAVMYGNDANGNSWKSKLLTFFTDANYSAKWGWLATYLDVVAATQYKKMNAANGPKIQPSTNGDALAYSLGNFFGEDNYYTTNYIDAVDFTGSEAQVEAFQYTWGQSFPGIEHPTESTVLHIAYKQRHNFEGWYDNAECTGTAITTVDQTYAGTLYAKWSIAPITYNLNGGQYNEYGWESKKDMYEDLNVDWNAFANKTNTWPAYETVYGVGNSNNGVAGKTDATFSTFFTNASYKDKWGWMVTYLDAIATKQGKTLPSTDAIPLRWGVGNFLCDDNNGSTTWHKAVDCTGEDGQLYTAQAYCSFTLPNPMYPTKEVTLNNPTKEGYIFDGWYAAADFSGAAVTKVNANTKGTLYAKWKEDAYSRTVTNGNYGTICLPKGSKQTSGAIFYELACKDAQYVYLDQVTILEAGVPYIFKATSNLLKVVYNTTEVATAGNHNGLYGTFVDIQDAATSDPNNVLEGNYLLVSNTIKKCGTSCKVLANRAYIKLEEIPNSASAAPGRNRVSMKYEGENEATGLDNITEDSNITPALQGTYDIMGRKLTEPSVTGFYIINGKKVIIVK